MTGDGNAKRKAGDSLLLLPSKRNNGHKSELLVWKGQWYKQMLCGELTL